MCRHVAPHAAPEIQLRQLVRPFAGSASRFVANASSGKSQEGKACFLHISNDEDGLVPEERRVPYMHYLGW